MVSRCFKMLMKSSKVHVSDAASNSVGSVVVAAKRTRKGLKWEKFMESIQPARLLSFLTTSIGRTWDMGPRKDSSDQWLFGCWLSFWLLLHSQAFCTSKVKWTPFRVTSLLLMIALLALFRRCKLCKIWNKLLPTNLVLCIVIASMRLSSNWIRLLSRHHS